MLLELTIKNFAIISELQLSFYKGMTALTGETGAGKSIIIDALGLLAGGRGSSDYIRQGSDKCLLEGLFEMPIRPDFSALMEELGIETEENLLIIQRDMAITGKNICRVNGRTVTLANLRRVGAYLVDIQGQNEHQELLQPEQHLSLIDEFGDGKYKELLADYRENYLSYRKLEQQIRKIQMNEQSFVQRMDMLRFQQEEIQQAQLQPEEEGQLTDERDKLSNYQKIVDALAHGYEALAAEGAPSLDGVGVALSEMQGIAHLDSDYEAISENIQTAYYLLQDAAGEISRQVDSLELDEERLESVEQRLDLIRQLKRKYGETIPAILAYAEKITEELTEADFSEEALDKMAQELQQKEAFVWQLAEKVHTQRKMIAHRLEKEILQELRDLYMENSQFEVVFNSGKKVLKEDGFDDVEFFLTTNPGEPLKPLVKVASGGELSRILLALKTIFSKSQGITSIIFDEVDTGVSGRVAQAIAQKISKIARNSQVLCITHLPQVAASADYQYYIVKKIQKGRTITQVKQLNEQERVDEIARMLAGAEITELTIQHAKELLEMARAAG